MPELSPDDKTHLAALEPISELVRDRVRSVVNHLSTGLWLWGSGGVGKSFLVLEELKKLKSHYVLHNSRMTGRGLFDALSEAPDTIHVIEDCETLLDDKNGLGVMRSALWSQSNSRPCQREVTWTAHRTKLHFTFTGGIIIIANRGPQDFPEINAIKTRIPVLQFIADNNQMAALMRSVALEGYRYGADRLTPNQCLEVADYIIEKFRGLNRNLDMRLLVGGWHDFIQWKTNLATTHWHELVETRLKETTVVPPRRRDRLVDEGQVALEISRMQIPYKDKIKEWEERTKHKGERSYYRALKRREDKAS